MEKKRERLGLTLLLMLLVILSYSMFLSFKADSKKVLVCKEAIELLKSQEPESNYCKAWCLMYE